MATGSITAAWKDATHAYAGVRVDDVEFVVRAGLLDDQGAARTNAQLKAALTAEVTRQRDAQLATPQPLSISGTVGV